MARLFNNATTDHVAVGDHADFNVGATDSCAFAVWVRLEAVGAVDRVIFAKGNYIDDAINPGWLLYMRSDEDPGVSVADSDSRVQAEHDANALVAGTWTHLMGVLDRSGPTLYLIRNGTQVASADATGVDTVTNATYDLRLARGHAGQDPWYGRLAEAMFWTKAGAAWTAGEIELLKQSRFGPVLFPYLKCYWPVWGSSPEVDLSGRQHNGTVTGTTLADHAPVGPYLQYDAAGYWAALAAAAATGGSQLMMMGIG